MLIGVRGSILLIGMRGMRIRVRGTPQDGKTALCNIGVHFGTPFEVPSPTPKASQRPKKIGAEGAQTPKNMGAKGVQTPKKHGRRGRPNSPKHEFLKFLKFLRN